MVAKGKSKKLVVYEDKRSGALFLNPTRYESGKFVLKSPPKEFGAALSGRTVSDSELGQAVKRALQQCD